jgi:putative transposase
LPISPAATGIEVGRNSFAVLSDGGEIDNPRQLEGGLAHLRRGQRKLARRKRGSKRRRQARVLVAKSTPQDPEINATRSTTTSAVGWWSGTA